MRMVALSSGVCSSDLVGRFLKFPHLLGCVLNEGVDPSNQEDIEHVPVIRFLNSILAAQGFVVEKVTASVFGRSAANLVGLNNVVVRPKTLRNAKDRQRCMKGKRWSVSVNLGGG